MSSQCAGETGPKIHSNRWRSGPFVCAEEKLSVDSRMTTARQITTGSQTTKPHTTGLCTRRPVLPPNNTGRVKLLSPASAPDRLPGDASGASRHQTRLEEHRMKVLVIGAA